MARTMQYLVSLTDETAEKLLWLEKESGKTRDAVITDAIEYWFDSNHPLEEEKTVERKISSISMSILQQTLDEGREICIPSLGITIKSLEKE